MERYNLFACIIEITPAIPFTDTDHRFAHRTDPIVTLFEQAPAGHPGTLIRWGYRLWRFCRKGTPFRDKLFQQVGIQIRRILHELKQRFAQSVPIPQNAVARIDQSDNFLYGQTPRPIGSLQKQRQKR